MEGLSNAVTRDNYGENDPDRPSTAAEIRERLVWKNKYLKSPEFMLKARKGGAKKNTCKQTAFAWKASSVAKSPFKTLKAAKKASASKKPIGFTATASLKAMGQLPRSNGCYELGPKYK